MSREIDDRVVSIEFDNQRFNSNVDSTIKSLDALKKELSFEGIKDGFQEIEKSAESVNLANIADSVAALENRFSTMGIVGMRVIQKLTDGLLNLSSKAISWATDGIIQGGIRRSMNLENAKFTLDGLLKDEEKVAAVMADVSASVDGTAYSLDQAASVASQLTASGIEAGDELLSALKAIAGTAAMTNADFSEIGHIFTTVAGNGRLMTMQLNQLSLRGLNVAATLGEQMNKSEAEIRDMVTQGKVSFDDFAKAMNSAFGEQAGKANETFTGAMSNIKAALARIGAKFVSPLVARNGPIVMLFNTIREQVNAASATLDPFVERYTKTMTVIAKGANEALKNLDVERVLNGFVYTPIEILINALNSLLSVLTPVGKAFKAIFPVIPSDRFLALAGAIKTMTGSLELSKDQASNLQRTFEGLFSIIDIGLEVIFKFGAGLSQVIEDWTGWSGGILSVTAAIGDFLVKVDEVVRNSKVIESAVTIFERVFGQAGKTLVEAGKRIREMVSLNGLGGIKAFLESIVGPITKVVNTIASALAKIATGFAEVVTSGDATMIANFIKAVLIDTLLVLMNGVITKFANLNEVMGAFWREMKLQFGNVSRIMYNLGETFRAWSVNINIKTIKELAISVGILALSCALLASINSDALYDALAAVTTLVMVMTFAGVQLFRVSKIGAMFGNAGGLIGFASSILILCLAVSNIAKIGDTDAIVKSLLAVAAMTILMMEIAKRMYAFDGKAPKGLFRLIWLAGSLFIVAKSIEVLSDISWDRTLIALGALSVAVIEMGALLKYMSKNVIASNSIKNALSVVALAGAIRIMANAISVLGNMETDQLLKGGTAFFGIVALLGIFAKSVLQSHPTAILAASVALVIISAAMEIVADVAKKFAKMEWEELGKAGAAIGGLTLIVSAFALLSKYINPASFILAAAGFVIMAGAFAIMTNLVNTLGSMKWESLVKAEFGMVTMTAIAVAFGLLSRYIIGFGFAAVGLLIFATALDVMSGIIAVLGHMEWDSILNAVKGIGALLTFVTVFALISSSLGPQMIVGAASLFVIAAALAVLAPAMLAMSVAGFIGVAGVLLGLAVGMAAIGAVASSFAAAIPAIVTFASAIAVLSLSLLAVGVGLGIIAKSIIKFGDVTETQMNKFGKSIREAVKAAGSAFPDFFAGLASGLIEFFATLAGAAKEIFVAIKELLVSAIQMLIEIAPELAELISVLITQVLAKLAGHASEWLESIKQIVMALLDTLTTMIPEIVDRLLSFLSELITVICNEGGDALSSIFETLGGALGRILGELIGSFIEGFANGMADGLGSLGDAVALFGEKFKVFADICRSIDQAAVDGCLRMLEMVLALTAAEVISALERIIDFVFPNSLGDTLENCGTAIMRFSDSIKNLSASSAQKALIAAQTGVLLAQLADGFVSMKSLNGSEMDNFMADVDALNASAISSRFNSAIVSAKSSLNTLKTTMLQIGKDCVTGFVNGLTNSKVLAMVDPAARQMAILAEAAVRDETGVESPSWKYDEIGVDCGQGLANGLNKSKGLVSDAANGLGESAMSGFGYVGDAFANLFSGGSGNEPTITPVLDLSEVESGATDIDTMFNDPSIGLNAQIEADTDQLHNDLIRQNELLSKLINICASGGNVTIDGTRLIGWVDARLGKLNG